MLVHNCYLGEGNRFPSKLKLNLKSLQNTIDKIQIYQFLKSMIHCHILVVNSFRAIKDS